MTNINKIEIINKLSEDEFFCMFETLVKNQNFDNVTRYNNCIVGEQKIMGRKTVRKIEKNRKAGWQDGF